MDSLLILAVIALGVLLMLAACCVVGVVVSVIYHGLKHVFHGVFDDDNRD